MKEECFKINWNYVPIKAHYFFLYGGFGGTIPYMQIVAKDFGISPLAVGIIYTVLPLCVWLLKPLFGFITDKLRNIRIILVILLVVTAASFFTVLYIPHIRDNKIENIDVIAICKEPGNELVIKPSNYDPFCEKEITDGDYNCELAYKDCFNNKTLTGVLNVTKNLLHNKSSPLIFSLKLHETDIVPKSDCDCLKQNLSSFICDSDFYQCDSFNAKPLSEYELYNFWIFVLLTVISGAGSATMWSLTDAACNEILSDNSRQYGKQRLWGTISWGIATLFSGFLNDVATGNSKHTNFFPGFYLMLTFLAIDMLILFTLRAEKANISMNICKDIGKIFSSLRTIVFSLGVYICGALSGLLWTYQFWFLTELGSKQLLLGLVAGVQCLIAEVPFFFISGWLIRKFGHFYCLIAALSAFALRLGLYSILVNPWWVLPIELLHGVTFAVFFASMTLYAVDYAPAGTEATMLGIFGGIFEGLGVATGSLLGGLGFDTNGGRWTFFAASMISLCSVPVLIVFHKILSRSEGGMELDKDRTIYMKEISRNRSQNSFK